ncbi:cryptochrome/photolyase family protein [Paeniglutamicibacter cryotolerans]|uniref:Deoxyribodipyrimidine photo-lyase n=1 Tax=Paeniglutamicibacter cryotolerans TaxID=670079 RepID=A0A839QKR0_9MICC|nr:deoxyribodipyrimidine photo-lyase [Paeniglutamicibacter cryotolerans]MBB2994616.1 deoxyribodipyrimidine photo-lyase [Paeniglutamicibacter cryotolerans]
MASSHTDGNPADTAIVWFRDDLRVADNPALLAAAAHGNAVGLYVLDQESAGIRPLGGAARWWLHHALEDLRAGLAGLGIPLILARGPAALLVPEICDQVGASAVFWNRRYGAVERVVDTVAKQRLQRADVQVESFQASLLHEPWRLATGAGTPYRVFTPFWKAASSLEIRYPLPTPAPGCGAPGRIPAGDALDDLCLLPLGVDWAAGLREHWSPSEGAGLSLLGAFIQDVLPDYATARERPDLHGSSRLSPYLRWGQLSPFQVWHALAGSRAGHPHDASVFASQLGWREFCWHQLFHNPDLAVANLRPVFNAYPWKWPDASEPAAEGPDTRAHLAAWQQGMTGLPLVDAGQRELWHTGWMHNRVRMVSASFLVKNLGIHWRLGEQWFWDTLVDADAASNPANWQWVAGSGADASPFFRIFNPETQAKKFDPEGRYTGAWVPEAGNPHYPEPLVDLKESRALALDSYAGMKAATSSVAVSSPGRSPDSSPA